MKTSLEIIDIPSETQNKAFFPPLSLQLKFPTLEEKPYPVWIYVIIFVLAGIPSISIPVIALWKCLKKKKSDKSHFNNMTNVRKA